MRALFFVPDCDKAQLPDDRVRDKKGSYAEYTLDELEELLAKIIKKEEYESAAGCVMPSNVGECPEALVSGKSGSKASESSINTG